MWFLGLLWLLDMSLEAKKVFDVTSLRNVASWNAMIIGFVKVGDLRIVRGLFDAMLEKNIVSFTTMIDGYAKAGDMAALRFLFEQANGKDVVCFHIWLDVSFVSVGSIRVSLVPVWINVKNSVLYPNLRSPPSSPTRFCLAPQVFPLAFSVFRSPLPERRWSVAAASGLSIHGCGEEAVDLFSRMLMEGVTPDEVTVTVFLSPNSL
ncbi:hypothetical protein RJT34_13773 [Clitoria ternatea]|uniref:Pentatricopeptide repeat-containing protein n=1 Tax=Clitoria ternatea TaxID=43366 RepID=A0AAN9JRA1_CLITE